MHHRATETVSQFATCHEITDNLLQAISDLYPEDFNRICSEPSKIEWCRVMNRAWDLANPADDMVYLAYSHIRYF